MTTGDLAKEIQLKQSPTFLATPPPAFTDKTAFTAEIPKPSFWYAKPQEDDDFSDLVIDGDEGGIGWLGPTFGHWVRGKVRS
jgi:hypothetical protein